MMDKKNDHKIFSSNITVNFFWTETDFYKTDTWCWSLPFCSHFTVTIPYKTDNGHFEVRYVMKNTSKR